MDRLDAIRLFVRVIETGSFAAAARVEEIGQPAVSKQIAALENRLGAQLIRRTSRSMVLTEAGQTFYESAVRLIAEFEAAESLIGVKQLSPSGLVRVSVAPVLGRLCIVPHLSGFLARYPEISIELSASEHLANLIEDGLDLAIRVGELHDSTMFVRRLAVAPFLTVASPEYLKVYGVPRTPSDLLEHSCIVFLSRGEPRLWNFSSASGQVQHLPKGHLRTADAEQVHAAALAGLGIVHGPSYMFSSEVQNGRLIPLLTEYETAPLAISAVHPAGRRLPTKVRVFIDFLADVFGDKAEPR